jgi:uncharacterized protein (DUF1015 family)
MSGHAHEEDRVQVVPFRAWLVRPDLAARVAAVPYDVVDTAEARALAAGNPLSYLHVTRAEIDLPEGTDPHSEAVYRHGATALRRFRADGVLRRESAPQFYLYRLTMGRHVQRGVVGCCAVGEYERRVVRAHETTRPDKEQDRRRHIEILQAQAEPVFLTCRDHAAVQALVAPVEQDPPLFDFTAPDGVAHTLWRFPDPAAVAQAFRDVPAAYVADGHHRAAAAVRVAQERRAAERGQAGPREYEGFLAVLFPASEVRILPYNRCVQDLNAHTPESLLAAVRRIFAVEADAPARPPVPGRVSMYLAGRWYGLSWAADAQADPVAGLDVSVLQDRLLGPVLGIDDPRTSPRIAFVGGSRGIAELEQRVDRGRAAVAFSMYPVTVDRLMAVADGGGIMPPKSTWFEPKLRDGMFSHWI